MKSVRGRLVLVMLVTTMTALMVAGAALLLHDLQVYRSALLDDLRTQAEILGRASSAALAFRDTDVARENLSLLKAKPAIRAAALYNTKGELFAVYVRGGTTSNPDIPGVADAPGERVAGDAATIMKPIALDDKPLGTIYLKADYEQLAHLHNYLRIIGAVLAAALGVALVMSTWLQSTVTKPILAMSDLARAVVEKRDFTLRAPKTTNDEIGYLADAFNRMLSEIGERTSALEQSNQRLARQILERETAEEALRRAEEELLRLNAELEQRVIDRTEQLNVANKELESFSYSVSHDLRAPVRAIAGFSKLLAEFHGSQLDEEANRKLGIVRSEAARMGALIDDLLRFSRLGRQALQMRVVDMEELVRINFEALTAQHPGPQPKLDLHALPQAMADRALLAQVWINLLSNAIKFSAKVEKPLIEVSATSDEREHTYRVRDNGAGFDPRYAAKLFGVFQRLHDQSEFQGTGVGLALVHRIVSRHGGRVWAESEPGAGATFYFTLPRSEDDGRV